MECKTNTYKISGTISGLTGGTLTLLNNGGDVLSRTADGPFTFATSVPSGGTYDVTVGPQQPPSQFCSVTNGSGPVVNANIANVTVTCVPIYMFTGIRNDVPVADLVGWTECYRDRYSNNTGRLAQGA